MRVVKPEPRCNRLASYTLALTSHSCWLFLYSNLTLNYRLMPYSIGDNANKIEPQCTKACVEHNAGYGGAQSRENVFGSCNVYATAHQYHQCEAILDVGTV